MGRIQYPEGHGQMLIFKKQSFPSASYIETLSYLAKENIKNINIYYREDLSKPIGHFCLNAIYQYKSTAAKRLCKKLTQDGADWYMAFIMAEINAHAFIELQTRTKDPKAELLFLLSKFAIKDIEKQPESLKSIISGLPLKLALELAIEDQESADKLAVIHNNQKLIRYASTEVRRQILENDFGV